MRVAVYRNLHKGCWSIAECTVRGNRGKLIRHADFLILANAHFIVKERARQRVCEKQCRGVHAWIVGEIVDAAPSAAATAVSYNPYRATTFTRRDNGAAVTSAAFVKFTESNGAVAIGNLG